MKRFDFDDVPLTPIGLTIDAQTSGLVRYYRRHLFHKVSSVFSLDVPPNWDENALLSILFSDGFFVVFPTTKFGLTAQPANISRFGVNHKPTRALVSNSYLSRSYDLNIGDNCVLVKMTPDYCGLIDVFNHFAEEYALTSMALSVNLINSKTAHVFGASSKSEAETIKSANDDVLSGKPYVVIKGKGITDLDIYNGNVRNNFIANDLLMTLKELDNRFNTFFGIPNANTQKRERLSLDEVNVNNAETKTRMQLFFDNVKKSFDEVNERYRLLLDAPCAIRWRLDDENTFND